MNIDFDTMLEEEPNQKNAPLPDVKVILLEAFGKKIVEESLGHGSTVTESRLSGQLDEIYDVTVHFDGYLDGPFDEYTFFRFTKGYIRMIYDDGHVSVGIEVMLND